jgi:hypothetical protein
MYPVIRPMRDGKYNLDSERIGGQFLVLPSTSQVKPSILTALEHHIEEYTRRDLTYDSDSLNAISSILLQYQRKGVELLNGIPLWVHQCRTGLQEAPLHVNYRFAYGLCWTHGSGPHELSPRRRHDFPSWSWAGWSHQIRWLPQASDDFRPSTQEFREFRYKKDSGELCLFLEPRRDPALTEHIKLIHVKALVLQLQFQWLQPSTLPNGITQSGYFLCSAQGAVLARLQLTRYTAAGQDFARRLCTETWTGLLMGHGKRFDVRYILVLGEIKPEDNFLERIGLVDIPNTWFEEQKLREAQFWFG